MQEGITHIKQLTRTHRALAELKGFADTMPNKNILINAVTIARQGTSKAGILDNSK